MSDPAILALDRLADLWRTEREAARRNHREQRELLDFGERVARGIALTSLTLEDVDAAAGGRVLLWLRAPPNSAPAESRVRSGDPVLLWAGSPDGDRTQAGVVTRVQRDRIGVAVDADYREFLEHGAVNLDREAPEVTFTRGEQAVARFRAAQQGSHLARLREVAFGDRSPEFDAGLRGSGTFCDERLDATQRDAVMHALSARDIALVHGPPGTGKTRTLVEVVRQAVARGERVLVSAPSNTAVDNLGERLADVGLAVVRLGHPARVSQALEARTLDALVEASEARARAKRWIADANALRRRVDRLRARGRTPRQELRELLSHASSLMRDARKTLDAERELQLARAQVVCATAAGAETAALGARLFDLVVLDEATQAVDPLALAALARGTRAVLAGDPRQLPPTILDPDAARAGLQRTLFERLAERWGTRVLRLLEVQYRMHEALMRFPSDSMYEGRLRAAPGVAHRTIEAVAEIAPDPLRGGPWHLVDCAGKGFMERRTADDPSTSNPGQAERTAREVRRLLSRGLGPAQIAVITPYLAQVRLLRDSLRDVIEAGLEIDTVDGFQGREKEAVIIDLVRSNEDGELGFLGDVRRMNVAITRARSFLLVLGDSSTLQKHAYYRNLMDAAEHRGAYLSAWADDADAL
jgi:ATP-dependent RNA/DNA helicase IGHMBP2